MTFLKIVQSRGGGGLDPLVGFRLFYLKLSKAFSPLPASMNYALAATKLKLHLQLDCNQWPPVNTMKVLQTFI